MPIKFRNILGKKKKPIDIFSNIKKPHLEEAYVKFPGKSPKTASKKRGINYAIMNRKLINKLKKRYGSKYTIIHTHPSNSFLPTFDDLISFLCFEEKRASVIVPTTTRKYPLGYFVMKKNKNYKHPEINDIEFIESVRLYDQSLSSDNPGDVSLHLKQLAKKYNFSYRFLPINNDLSEEAEEFRSSRQSLEAKLAVISFILISLSILFNLSNITGNIISMLQPTTLNVFSIGLFIVGLCFVGLILLSKKFPAKT